MKKLIRLTEGDLHRIVKRSVGKILKEMNSFDTDGRRSAKKLQRSIGDMKIDTDAINKQIYPEHKPKKTKKEIDQILKNAKNRLKRKLYGESSNRFLREGYVSNDGNGMVGGSYGSSSQTGYTYLPWEDALYEMTQKGLTTEEEEQELCDYLGRFEDNFKIGAISEYSWDTSTNASDGRIIKDEDDYNNAIEFIKEINHPLLTPERKQFIINYFKNDFYRDFDNPDYDDFIWDVNDDDGTMWED